MIRSAAKANEVCSCLAYHVFGQSFILTTRDQFLDDLENRLRPLGEQERSKLQSLKDAEHRERGLGVDPGFNSWDDKYYQRIDLNNALALDDNQVRAYFPVEHVVKEVLDIYQELLSVRFELTEHKAWAEDVQVYAVSDTSSSGKNEFLGWCYLDLYPRRASSFTHVHHELDLTISSSIQVWSCRRLPDWRRLRPQGWISPLPIPMHDRERCQARTRSASADDALL